MWDEEKQEWVNRWGKGGKNREKEEQWIHEVPNNARTSMFALNELIINLLATLSR